ncbi:MAG TPA: tetratricopeptide repeat protein [Chitinophagaceae bacterium]|nr:tetratricopeptide repeat protein [Chitinophagaceae bacterium]
MKRFFLTALVILTAITLFAQKLDKAKELFKAGKLSEAKTEIDNFLAQEKNAKNSEALYMKAKIYAAISFDNNLKTQVPNARMTAFETLKKYTEVDDKMLISLQIDGYKPINDIYTGYYQEAANAFNSKDFEAALRDFQNAITISKFMNEKGWIKLPLDTNSVLYAGVSAERLSKPEDAAKYYGIIVENKVKGESFVEIYKWEANHYFEKKDYATAEKYLALGKEVYPADAFWPGFELDMARDRGSKQDLFKKYDEIVVAFPSNHLYRYNYAVELYQEGYNTDSAKRPANSAELIKKASENISEALKLKPDYSRAQLFAGQIAYNQGVDLLTKSKQIKGTKPEDVKKKADIKAEALVKFDEALPHFLEVEKLLSSQGKLKMDDKNDLKEAYDLLITIYDQKKLQDKVKEYEVKFNDVDRKH